MRTFLLLLRKLNSDLEHRRTWSDKGLFRKVSIKQINCIKKRLL